MGTEEGRFVNVKEKSEYEVDSTKYTTKLTSQLDMHLAVIKETFEQTQVVR